MNSVTPPSDKVAANVAGGDVDLPAFSVVIPAFNEAQAIVQVIEELDAALAQVGTYEIVVVDDCSTDETAELAASAGARVVRHPHNMGYGRAIKTGLQAATYDTIVITDADFTYPAEPIEALLKEYAKGFDMVVAARTGSHYRGSWLKGPLRTILKWIVEWAADREIPDINSGLRVFSKSLAEKFEHQLCDTFSFTTSITLAYMMSGKFVAYHPIHYRERVGDTNIVLYRDALKTFGYILQAILYHSPLKIFVPLALSCLLLALISVIIGITFKMATGFMMGVGSIIAAMIVFSLGLLADLLRQVLGNLLNNRPD